jgi:hypothetical protein
VSQALGDSALISAFLRDTDIFAEPRVGFGLPWSATPACVPADLEHYEVHIASRRGLQIERADTDGLIEVRVGGQRLQYPDVTLPLFTLIAEKDSIPVPQIYLLFGDHFTDSQLSGFLADLVRKGLVSLRAIDGAQLAAVSDGRAEMVAA